MIKTDILRNGYKILQDSERFQFGIDAVLLADFASKALKGKENVIDLGTGTGIIPLLCRRKSKGSPEQPIGMPGRKLILPGWKFKRLLRIWRLGAWR